MNMDDKNKDYFAILMEDPAYRREFEKEWLAEEILTQIDDRMKEEAISKTELARRMGCKPPNVSQLLRKGTNLTLGKMVDLALALGCRFTAPKLQEVTTRPPWFAGQVIVAVKEIMRVSATTQPAQPTSNPHLETQRTELTLKAA